MAVFIVALIMIAISCGINGNKNHDEDMNSRFNLAVSDDSPNGQLYVEGLEREGWMTSVCVKLAMMERCLVYGCGHNRNSAFTQSIAACPRSL